MGDECLVFRDADYGALVILEGRDDLLLVYDHGFRDKGEAASVLRAHGHQVAHSGPETHWRLDTTAFRAVATLESVLSGVGYERDLLAERAIFTKPLAWGSQPDLPARASAGGYVYESLEQPARMSAQATLRVLERFGDVREATVDVFPRPYARCALGRPLPFVRVRGFVSNPLDEVQRVQASLREALDPQSAVRATVESVEHGRYAFEFALAPSREACAEGVRRADPSFDPAVWVGERVAKVRLGAALGEDDRREIRDTALRCGAVTSFSTSDARTVVVRVPSSYLGERFGDQSFNERVTWLFQRLDPWRPILELVGEARADRPRVEV